MAAASPFTGGTNQTEGEEETGITFRDGTQSPESMTGVRIDLENLTLKTRKDPSKSLPESLLAIGVLSFLSPETVLRNISVLSLKWYHVSNYSGLWKFYCRQALNRNVKFEQIWDKQWKQVIVKHKKLWKEVFPTLPRLRPDGVFFYKAVYTRPGLYDIWHPTGRNAHHIVYHRVFHFRKDGTLWLMLHPGELEGALQTLHKLEQRYHWRRLNSSEGSRESRSYRQVMDLLKFAHSRHVRLSGRHDTIIQCEEERREHKAGLNNVKAAISSEPGNSQQQPPLPVRPPAPPSSQSGSTDSTPGTSVTRQEHTGENLMSQDRYSRPCNLKRVTFRRNEGDTSGGGYMITNPSESSGEMGIPVAPELSEPTLSLGVWEMRGQNVIATTEVRNSVNSLCRWKFRVCNEAGGSCNRLEAVSQIITQVDAQASGTRVGEELTGELLQFCPKRSL